MYKLIPALLALSIAECDPPPEPGEKIWAITYEFEDPLTQDPGEELANFITLSQGPTGLIPADTAFGIAVGDSDDVIVVGGSLVQDGGVTNQRGQAIAFTSAGVKRWTITPAPSGLMTAIDSDSNGNLWMGGYFAEVNSADIPVFGILQKYDKDGNLLWPPGEPGFNPENMRVDSILVDDNDDVYSLFRFADGQSKLNKRDSSGTELWEVNVPELDTPFVEKAKLEITDNGNRICLLLPQTDTPANGAWVGSFNSSNGSFMADAFVDDVGYVVRGISCKTNNEVVIAGRKVGASATSDAYVRKINIAGGTPSTTWELTLSGTAGFGGEGMFHMVKDNDDNIYVVGVLRDQATAAKIDDNGVLVWQFFNDVEGGARGSGFGIAIDSQGNAVAVGQVADQAGDTLGYAEKHAP